MTELYSNMSFVLVQGAVLVVLLLLVAVLSPRGFGLGPKYKPARLMNKSEERLYSQINRALPAGWSVMTQVSYGAFLQNTSFRRYRAVMCKRADFVVVDPKLNVAAVIEYHGGGHFGVGRRKATQVRDSDRIKRRALSQADIPLIELPASVRAEEVRQHVAEVCFGRNASSNPINIPSNQEVPHAS